MHFQHFTQHNLSIISHMHQAIWFLPWKYQHSLTKAFSIMHARIKVGKSHQFMPQSSSNNIYNTHPSINIHQTCWEIGEKKWKNTYLAPCFWKPLQSIISMLSNRIRGNRLLNFLFKDRRSWKWKREIGSSEIWVRKETKSHGSHLYTMPRTVVHQWCTGVHKGKWT